MIKPFLNFIDLKEMFFSSQVLMDENLLKVARERPFYIRKDKNPEFYSSIHRDTNFLTQHSMMDYSLLVGIDADTNDLVLVKNSDSFTD